MMLIFDTSDEQYTVIQRTLSVVAPHSMPRWAAGPSAGGDVCRSISPVSPYQQPRQGAPPPSLDHDNTL